MSRTVKTRSYSGEGRRAAAAERRRRILHAALEMFAAQGYAGTSMGAVARRAGVALDTVYALVGRKPELVLAVHDLVLGEEATDVDGQPLPALQRRYVAAVRAAPDARSKIQTYAAALAGLLPRTAPLMEALREAGETDEGCRRVWESVDERRAANMRLFAADLRATGELRDDLTDDDVADLVWSMNAPGYYTALARRGWEPERYAALVADVWTRTFLR
ncbi:MAG: TetR/AcrR family transcriptional regulator [Actinomycetes bacterium]